MAESTLSPEQRLKGIIAEKNIEADQLEKALGIVFPKILQKIPLTLNSRMLVSEQLKGIISPDEILTGKTSMTDWYDPSLHAYFYKQKGEEDLDEIGTKFVNYHENLNGFTNSLNPELTKFITTSRKIVISSIFSDQIPPREVTEKGLVYSSFNEGISTWGAFETLYKDNGRDVENPLSSFDAHKLTFNNDNSLANLSTDDRIIIQIAKDKIKLIKLLDPRTFRENFKVSKDLKQKFVDQFRGQDILGYYFVNECLYRLRESRMTRAQAMVLLIKNPPDTISQLTHPTEYAKKLLSKPQ